MSSETSYNVRDFGAQGDGRTLDTGAIQSAIDAASNNGGGVVDLPPGTYRTGTLFLNDDIVLDVGPGAILEASTNLADYVEMEHGHNKDRQPYHLIVAQGKRNVSIVGTGRIAGNGPAFWYPRTGPDAKPGTYRWYRHRERRVSPLVEIAECSDVRIEGVTIIDSPGWTVHLHQCDRVLVRGVRIDNDLFGPNTDGIDVNGCHDVSISDCFIETGDDAIVLKTTPNSRSCERVTVTNCFLRTNCVALKLGATESYHDIRGVVIDNCVIYKSNRGFGLYNFNGGTFEDIVVSNVVCDTGNEMVLNRPIHFDLRKCEGEQQGTIRNVNVRGFLARTSGRILMTAEEGTVIENVVLRDVSVAFDALEDAAALEDQLQSGHGTFSNGNPEARRANAVVAAENVTGLAIDTLSVKWPKEIPEFEFAHVWLRGVEDAVLRLPGAKPVREGSTVVDAEGCAVELRQ